MVFISLQSGSNGNCLYVESGGVRLLFDAVISGRKARAAPHGDMSITDCIIRLYHPDTADVQVMRQPPLSLFRGELWIKR